MAKHHDLEFLEVLRSKTKQDELKQAADQQIAERPEHESTPRRSTGADDSTAATQAQRRDRFNAPHRQDSQARLLFQGDGASEERL
jgi:hypothetical protein